MIIAHLPAGYLLTKIMSLKFDPDRRRRLWVCGLAASMLPDLDILWFHIEGGVRNHRFYPTHWPLFWLALFALAALAIISWEKIRPVRPAPARPSPRGLWATPLAYALVMLANVMLHLLLDALAAPVFYAAPFSWDPAQLITVPAVYDWWVWNFLRHWTFQLELMIWATAALTYGLGAWAARPPDA